MTIRVGDREIEISDHARKRMAERGATLADLEALVAAVVPFDYYHEGRWKTGYYDSMMGLFMGEVDGIIATVIPGASVRYIENLRGKT